MKTNSLKFRVTMSNLFSMSGKNPYLSNAIKAAKGKEEAISISFNALVAITAMRRPLNQGRSILIKFTNLMWTKSMINCCAHNIGPCSTSKCHRQVNNLGFATSPAQ